MSRLRFLPSRLTLPIVVHVAVVKLLRVPDSPDLFEDDVAVWLHHNVLPPAGQGLPHLVEVQPSRNMSTGPRAAVEE